MAKPTKSWGADRARDIELAQARLGDVDGRCRWLLDVFTATPPDAISSTERAVWRDNLMALVLGPRPGGGWRWAHVYEREPLGSELRGLWQKIGALVGSHRESVELPPLKGWLGRQDGPADPGVVTPYVRFGRGYKAGDFEAALLHAVADLLIACQRLRECDECHHLFVAKRRQTPHPKCARRVHDRNRPSRAKKGAK